MTENISTPVDRSPEGIASWLIERVAHYLRMPPAEIDPDCSLARYGLDSVYAFALCGDIEDRLGVDIDPTLIWDVDSVTALVKQLVELTARPAPS